MSGKYPKLEPVTECPICSINLYKIDGKGKPYPQVMPCGVGGKFRKADEQCPFESESDRAKIDYSRSIKLSEHGSSLADAI